MPEIRNQILICMHPRNTEWEEMSDCMQINWLVLIRKNIYTARGKLGLSHRNDTPRRKWKALSSG